MEASRAGQEPDIVVVMGVAGSGKTTVAKGIAVSMNWLFAEGDAFHPEANVEKMHSGVPLTDEDRWPWLQAIADEIDRLSATGERAVIACSALKRAYRDILVHGRDDIQMVFLDGTQDLIADRLAARKGHFMPPDLLASQFRTLERPGANERPITVSIDAPVERIVDDIVSQLNLVSP
jgi:gluconokinase